MDIESGKTDRQEKKPPPHFPEMKSQRNQPGAGVTGWGACHSRLLLTTQCQVYKDDDWQCYQPEDSKVDQVGWTLRRQLLPPSTKHVSTKLGITKDTDTLGDPGHGGHRQTEIQRPNTFTEQQSRRDGSSVSVRKASLAAYGLT